MGKVSDRIMIQGETSKSKQGIFLPREKGGEDFEERLQGIFKNRTAACGNCIFLDNAFCVL
jgi:hypothetical protein